MAIEDRVQLIKETGWRQAAPASCHRDLCPALHVVTRFRRVGVRKTELAPSHSSIHDAADCATAVLGQSHAGFLPRTIRWKKYRQCSGVAHVARRVAQTGNLFRSSPSVVFPQYEKIPVWVFGNLGAAPARYRRHQSVRRRAGCVNARS